MPKPVTPKWCRTDFHVAGQSSLTGGISFTSAICQLLIVAPSCWESSRRLSAHLVFAVNDTRAAAAPDARGDRARLVARLRRRERRRRGAADDPARPPLQPRRRAVGVPRVL